MLEKATPELKRKLQKNLDDLKTLHASPGWKYLAETVLEAELEATLARLAQQPNLDEASSDYYRGALWALMRFSKLPESAQKELEQTLTLVAAQLETERDDAK